VILKWNNTLGVHQKKLEDTYLYVHAKTLSDQNDPRLIILGKTFFFFQTENTFLTACAYLLFCILKFLKWVKPEKDCQCLKYLEST